MDTHLDGRTLEFAKKILETVPRNISRERLSQLERSGDLRKFLSLLADENEKQLHAAIGVLDGTHGVSPVLYTLDLGAKPNPDGLQVEKHVDGGMVKIKKSANKLFVNGKRVTPVTLEEDVVEKIHDSASLDTDDSSLDGIAEVFEGIPVLNANMLDFLLEHPELIPSGWFQFRERLHFAGTIYSGGHESYTVRCLKPDRDGRNDNKWMSEPFPFTMFSSPSIAIAK